MGRVSLLLLLALTGASNGSHAPAEAAATAVVSKQSAEQLLVQALLLHPSVLAK
jgi:hypothetical protein